MADIDLFSNRCPSCGGSILTPADAAAHVCPTDQNVQDPTPQQVATAAQKTRDRYAQRAALTPDRENLTADAKKMVQAVIDGWDREVEAIVILVPKGTLDNMAVMRFLEGDHRERQKRIFEFIMKRAGGTVRRMNGS